ncbi:McrB family protein [Janibacter massiliensis]|uniref:McrB family protein n=1 Tax=Janibacter massiliensis TaxID=2058291 RepID=UPI000D113CBB|nr:AAA family ATPase [Janibacter massiliensis]
MSESVRKEVLIAALIDVLRESHGHLPASQAIEAVRQRVELTEYELSRNPSGHERFDTFLRWESSGLVTLGWIVKEYDGWVVTEAGRAAMSAPRPENGWYRFYQELYRREKARLRLEERRTAAELTIATALDLLEPGTWTGLDDLVSCVETDEDAVVTWLAAHQGAATRRVLGAEGQVLDRPRWRPDDDADSIRAALVAEGLQFDPATGRASLAGHLGREDLLPDEGDPETTTRAWLVRGSNVSGKDMVPTWLRESFVSLAATHLRTLSLPVERRQIAEAVEIDYASQSYNQRSNRLRSFDLFLNRMSIDDVVVTVKGSDLVIGHLISEPTQVASSGGLSNLRREVRWENPDRPVPFSDLPEGVKARLKSQDDVIDLTTQLDALRELAGETTKDETAEVPDAPQTADLQDPTQDLADELHVDLEWLQKTTRLLRQRKQIIFYGPPGTGKTYVAQKLAEAVTDADAVKLIQFHPAYTYEDFFEGYRPTPNAAGDGVQLALRPGPFRKLVDRASDNPGTAYILIVDEINRANLAKVFGELYFLLEYRKHPIDLLYAEPDAEPFIMPPNVFIIGTMNTADRSIALVDAAMRRRFAFLPMHPDERPTAGLLRRWLAAKGGDTELADIHDELNSRIDDAEFKIGPSYFMRDEVAEEGGLELMWETSIVPLLEEHYFGDSQVDVGRRFSLDDVRRSARRLREPSASPAEGSTEGQSFDSTGGAAGAPEPGDVDAPGVDEGAGDA